jgi:hypothetical protein
MPCSHSRREGDVNSSIRDDVARLIATQELLCGDDRRKHVTGLSDIV